MSPRLRWILAIVGLLGANLVAMAVLVGASMTRTAHVLPTYERPARVEEAAEAEAAQSRMLAWSAEAAIDQGAIAITMRDAAGAPVIGARVRVAGYHRASPEQTFEVELAPAGDGHYRVAHAARAGWHDLALEVERGDARFVQKLAVEVR